MKVDQIRHHPFFYGVNWNAIRQIEAPFIPRLRSITDTSYFPTDELEHVPEEPAGADNSGTNKDLAFLGCVGPPRFRFCRSLTFNGPRGDCRVRTGTRSSGSPSRPTRSDRACVVGSAAKVSVFRKDVTPGTCRRFSFCSYTLALAPTTHIHTYAHVSSLA